MVFSGTAMGEFFWDVFFPSTCLGCGETLQYSKHEIFCPICHEELVVSDTHLMTNHPLRKRVNTEFPFRLVLSKYRFPNHSRRVANLIYGLKYQNLRYIGRIEGEDYGRIIAPMLASHHISAIVPTPLHWKKEIQRGYNQSLDYARGISYATDIPVMESILRRVKRTRSQTTLNKKERIENMKNAFKARRVDSLVSPDPTLHFLLVDDVVTSGVTLAEMARTLNDAYPGCRCSLCTLAYKDY